MKLRFLILLFFFAIVPDLSLASDDTMVEIVVNKGDNLINICKKVLVDPGRWIEIAGINNLEDSNRIFPGERLSFPPELLKGIPFDGIVSFIKGQADLQSKVSGKWTPLRLNDKVHQGVRIRTWEESAVEITFNDGTVFFIKEDTALDLISAESKTPLVRVYDFVLDIGRTFSKVKRATGHESRFMIETPALVAAARGTEFHVSVDQEASTRCEVLEGRVGVERELEEIELGEGEGIYALKDKKLPDPRRLLSPPHFRELKSIYKSLPLILDFEQIEDAHQYKIQLTKDATFRDIMKTWIIRPVEALKIFDLDDGEYYIRTLSIDEVGLEGPPLEFETLNIRVNPLPPFIQSPTDNSRYRERSVMFKWLRVEDAASYAVQVAEDPDFKVIKEEKKNLQNVTYSTGQLDFKTYYFRTRSRASDGYEGIWSDSISFSIVPPPPSPPIDAPEMDEENINLRWRDLGEDISYHFQMSKDKTFNNLIMDRRLDQPSIKLPKPKDPGIYYARTSAIDSEGYEGSFSLPQSFEIEKKFPYGIVTILMTALMAILL